MSVKLAIGLVVGIQLQIGPVVVNIFFLLSYFVGPTIGLQILSSLIPLYYFLMFRISQQIVFKFTAGLWLLTSQDQHVNSFFFFFPTKL